MEEKLTFKVLWLDDDFQSLIPNPDKEQEKINETRLTLQEDASVAESYGLSVDCVYDKNVFYEKLKDYQQYQAVIFDLKGLDLNDSTEDSPMPDAYKVVEKLPLAVYVYSGNPEDPVFKITLKDLKLRGRVFGKLLDGPDKMFEKIKDDLNLSYNVYCGHQECINLFSKAILRRDSKEYMDNILTSYANKGELCPSIYNSIRHILEDMMSCLVYHGMIDRGIKSLNDRIKYLTEQCESVVVNGNKVIYHDKPLVPYTECPMEIKYAISYLGKMSNYYSHFLERNPQYLRSNETTLEYNLMLQDSVYSAFFVAIKWFHATMNKG